MSEPDETAEKLSERALENLEHHYDKMMIVAGNFQASGHLGHACDAFKRVLEGQMRHFGEDVPLTAKTMDKLGEVLFSDNKFEEAEHYLTWALRIRCARHLLLDPKETRRKQLTGAVAAICRDRVGRFYEEVGNYKAAKDIRQAGLDLGQAICGSEEVTTRTPNSCMRRKRFEYLADHVAFAVPW